MERKREIKAIITNVTYLDKKNILQIFGRYLKNLYI